MTKRKWKKIAFWATGVFAGLVVILMVHIWWVTRPHIDAGTRVMARIDLHRRIGLQDAQHIRSWLYGQRGVRYVLVNPASEIAVFSFSPLENDGNRITQAFRAELGYQEARRFLPPPGRAGGCPAGF
jgi:hypothetical protein